MKPNKRTGIAALSILAVVIFGNIFFLTKTEMFRTQFNLDAIPESSYTLDSGEIVDYQNTDNVRMLVTDGLTDIELESNETGKIVDISEDGFIIQLDTTTAEYQLGQTVYRGNEILGYTDSILDGRRIACKLYTAYLSDDDGGPTNEQ